MTENDSSTSLRARASAVRTADAGVPENRLSAEATRARGEAGWLRAMADDARPLGADLAAGGRAAAALYTMRAAELYAGAGDLAERYATALDLAAEHARAAREPLPEVTPAAPRESRPAEGVPRRPSNVTRYEPCPAVA